MPIREFHNDLLHFHSLILFALDNYLFQRFLFWKFQLICKLFLYLGLEIHSISLVGRANSIFFGLLLIIFRTPVYLYWNFSLIIHNLSSFLKCYSIFVSFPYHNFIIFDCSFFLTFKNLIICGHRALSISHAISVNLRTCLYNHSLSSVKFDHISSSDRHTKIPISYSYLFNFVVFLLNLSFSCLKIFLFKVPFLNFQYHHTISYFELVAL